MGEAYKCTVSTCKYLVFAITSNKVMINIVLSHVVMSVYDTFPEIALWHW